MTKKYQSNKSGLTLISFCLLSLMVLVTGTSKAQEKGIEFLPMTLDEAKTFSASTKKLIFIDCYTTWCGPCKWMSANIFTNDTVADFYNRNFLCLKMDMEKGQGKRVAKKYEIMAYPTLLFLDENGEVQERKAGASRDVMDYVDLGLSAMNPYRNLYAHRKSFEQGERDPSFLASYLEKLSVAGQPSKAIFDTLYASWGEEDYAIKENFELYSKYDFSLESRAFQNLLTHYQWYSDTYGKPVDKYVQNVVLVSHRSALRKKDEDRLKKIDEALAKLPKSRMGELQWLMESNTLQRVEDPKKYIKHSIKGAKDYSWDNAGLLNSMAWYIYKNSKDEDELKAALEMSERSLELQQLPAFMDTKASLLFELGRKDEAIQLQMKAIEKVKKEGGSVKNYEDTLEFFKKRK